MSDTTIETVEELREKLTETAEALDRAEREQETAEALARGEDPYEYEEPELVVHGVDDFAIDKQGGVWCGDQRVGGPPVIDNADPSTESAFRSLELSPRDLQLAGQRARDDAGRFTAAPEPEEPVISPEPCGGCGRHINLSRINPEGRMVYDETTGEGHVLFRCGCGQGHYTPGNELPERVQAAAIESHELMDFLAEECERAAAHKPW